MAPGMPKNSFNSFKGVMFSKVYKGFQQFRYCQVSPSVLPFLGEFPKSGVSGGKLGKEFGPLGIPQHAQILPQSWGILMKIGERKLEFNPLLHVKFGQHFVVYSQ